MNSSLRMRLHDVNAQVREAAVLELVFDPELEYLGDLQELLQDSEADIRRTAIQALGAMNHPESLLSLREMLLDEVEEVVTAAEHAIIKMGDIAAGALIEWLTHADWPRRVAALQLLPQLRIPLIAEHVLPLLQDPIWEVRAASYHFLAFSPESLQSLKQALQREDHPLAREALLLSLGEIQDFEACDLLLSFFLDPMTTESVQTLASALSHYGAECHPDLLESGLWSPNPEVRSLSAALLAQTGYPKLEEALIPLLRDSNLSVRQTVAYAMYQGNPEQVFWEYLAGIYHTQDSVFALALDELSHYPDPRTGPQLLVALDEYLDSERCIPLIQALGHMHYEAAAPTFVELLDVQPSLEAQLALVKALGKLKAWRAYGPLQTRLGHPEKALREAVAQALAQIAADEPQWARVLRLETEQISESESLTLLEFLAQHPQARNYLAFLVGEYGDGPRVGAIFKQLLRVQDPLLGPLVDMWLRRFGEPESPATPFILKALEFLGLNAIRLEILFRWLSHRNGELREAVIPLLRPLAEALRPQLNALLDHELWFVRHSALAVMSEFKDAEMIARLGQCLEDRDRDVRIAAIAQLGRIASPKSLPALIEALEHGYRDIRSAAACALRNQSPQASILEALENALIEDEAAEVRMAAAESLVALQHPEALDLLQEALEYEEVDAAQAQFLALIFRLDASGSLAFIPSALATVPSAYCRQALEILLQHNAPHCLKELEACTQSQDPQIRYQALRALLKHTPEKARKWLKREDSALQMAALEALEIVPGDRKRLLTLLQTEDARLRLAVLQKIQSCPALHELYLEQLPHEKDESLQQVLIELLCACSQEIALEGLQYYLQRGEFKIQKSAVWALGLYLETGAKALLLRALQQGNAKIRSEIFALLASLPQTSLTLLSELSESWDSQLRLQAIRTLGRLGESALPVLSQIWQEEDLAVQVAILESLKALRSDSVLPLLKVALFSSHENLRLHALEVLKELGQDAMSLLVDMAQFERIDLRYDACRILADLEPNSQIWLHLQGINSHLASRRAQHLLALQQLEQSDWQIYATHLRFDPSFLVRKLYCESHFADRSYAQKTLLRCLRSDVLPVRASALLSCLQAFEAAEIQNELLQLWNEAPDLLKEVLLRACAELGMPGQAVQGLEAHSQLVRYSALSMLGHFRLGTARAQIVDVFEQDTSWQLRSAALWALGQIPGALTLKLIQQGLADTHLSVRLQSIACLQHFESPQSTTLLIELLQESHDLVVYGETVRALGHAQHEAALPQLMQSLKEQPDAQLRGVILNSLKAMGTEKSLALLKDISLWDEKSLALQAEALL